MPYNRCLEEKSYDYMAGNDNINIKINDKRNVLQMSIGWAREKKD
jgi:hypothetical protein